MTATENTHSKERTDHFSEKIEWTRPSLQILNVSETNGEPGADEGDGAFPNTANPKISG